MASKLKKLGNVIIFLLFFTCIVAQNNERRIPLVIVENEKVVNGAIKIKILIKINGITSTYTASYWPGSLILKELDYSSLLASNYDSIFLQIDTNDYTSEKGNVYEIQWAKPRLQDYFTILYLYNLDIRKYRKRFSKEFNGKNFVYEINSSSGQVLPKPKL